MNSKCALRARCRPVESIQVMFESSEKNENQVAKLFSYAYLYSSKCVLLHCGVWEKSRAQWRRVLQDTLCRIQHKLVLCMYKSYMANDQEKTLIWKKYTFLYYHQLFIFVSACCKHLFKIRNNSFEKLICLRGKYKMS